MSPEEPRPSDQADAAVAAWRDTSVISDEQSFAFTRRVVRLAGKMEAVLQRSLPRFGLSKAEFDVLTSLASSGAPFRLRPTELSGRTVLTSGGTSNTIRRLANRGLVAREADPADARVIWVLLTQDGHALIVRALQAVARGHEVLLRPAAPALPQANNALRQVISLLDD